MELDEVVRTILERPGPTRLVAVDGRGGAGKSTFARALAAAAGGAPVIHTDDFASWDEPIDWWPRLRDEAIAPLARGAPARFRRYDADARSLGPWVAVDPAPLVIIEGVTSARREWADDLAFVIWIETPDDTRLERVLARDGGSALAGWAEGESAEQAHFDRDPTRDRADLVLRHG